MNACLKGVIDILNVRSQIYGNNTFVSSGGPISASVVFGNCMYFDARGDAKLSILEVFLGSINPGTLFRPKVLTNYSDPVLWAHSERGDISVLGLSGSPLNAAVTGHIFIDVATQLGAIKAEINGGGFNGNYSVTSLRGKSIVEIDGEKGPLSGTFNRAFFARYYR